MPSSKMTHSTTTSLNPEQQRAVFHVDGPLLVLAGAGSGKTRVVTHRIAHLIDSGVEPSEILAVTFTNKAAEEMRSRISSMKNVQVFASTFHSLGAKILRESISHLGYQKEFAIYDEEDSLKLLKSCLAALNLPEEKAELRKLKHEISTAKNELIRPGGSGRFSTHSTADVYTLYQKKLKECNAVDFDDLLCLTVQLLQNHPEVLAFYQKRWRFLLIDEYQDTNLAQYTLAKLLAGPRQNLFAVGDPDQSIYSWRGARPQNILNFEKDFPGAKVITLEQNYRSTCHILNAANALIGHNDRRFKKDLWSELGDGAKVGLYTAQGERQEADFVARRISHFSKNEGLSLASMAIFYRTNAQSRPMEDALLSHKIAYQIIGGVSFYERREIKDLLAFLRVIISDADLISFLRTLNLPKRGLGPTAIEKLQQGAEMRRLPIFTFCKQVVEAPATSPEIKLSAKQRSGLAEYVSLIEALRLIAREKKLYELLEEVVRRSRYLTFLEEDEETAQERKENVGELITKAYERGEEEEGLSVSQFLEELSLRTQDENLNAGASVKLMTLHNSKGLEFDTVFLVGLEEDLLPHINSKEESSVEEERRLCYVGMTRAKKRLILSHATYRFVWGTSRYMYPSRFLKELPPQYLQKVSAQSQPYF